MTREMMNKPLVDRLHEEIESFRDIPLSGCEARWLDLMEEAADALSPIKPNPLDGTRLWDNS